MATISSTLTLVDNMSSYLTTIQGHVDDLNGSLGGLGGAAESAQRQVDGAGLEQFGKQAQTVGDTMTKTGAKMTVGLTMPLIALGKTAYDTAASYEAAFTGVRKTTDATEAQYQELYAGLLALKTPTKFESMAGIMEMAGQLGVVREELLDFTEAYDMLQISTNIQGEQGAADIAKFLNITEGGTQNIKRFGGTVVDLGNNFATTEQDILHMATRMASTGDLVGMYVPDILAIATAMSSVGIEAEAGGSAAGKLMKKMQLASEVGTSSWQTLMDAARVEFPDESINSIHDLQMQLDLMKSTDVKAWAVSLGMTADELTKAVGAAADLEYFAQISGKTAEQFQKDWSSNPAQSMLDFFMGLNQLDASGTESAVAMLDKMGITEIRLSNMVAAMTSNPKLLQDALAMAYSAYAQNPNDNALTEEFGKFLATQQSQNAILENQARNTEANFGENLIQALQPALDKVNELLTAFNSLSEADQSAVINTFMIFAIGGPIVTAVGETVSAIGKISTKMGTIVRSAGGWKSLLSTTLASPAFWGVAAGGAILLLIGYLDSIPTKMESILGAAKDIPITIDQESYTTTMGQIAEVQEALNGLKPGETIEEFENASIAVTMGVGTESMFGTALGYEAEKANTQINQIITDYAVQMREVERTLATAAAVNDTAAVEAAQAEYQRLNDEMDAALTAARTTYTEKISDLFNGMASKYPEQAAVLEKAGKQYDLSAAFAMGEDMFYNMEVPSNWGSMTAEEQAAFENAYNAKVDNLQQYILSLASELGYLEMPLDEAQWMLSNGTPWDTLMDGIWEQANSDLNNSLQTVSDNPILASWLKSIIDNPEITENLDFSKVQGAFDGIIEAIDYQSAIQKATEDGKMNDFGSYLVQGLADGVSSNAGLIEPPFTEVAGNALDSLQSAFGIHSPSTLMMAQGIFIPQGLALGITAGSGVVVAAMVMISNQGLSVARAILTTQSGYSMGWNVAMGMVNGIRAGTGAVAAAMRSMVQNALAAGNAAAGIHSPSKMTYWSGSMLIAGYANSIEDGTDSVDKAIGTLIGHTEKAWDKAAWDDIAVFAGLENQQLLDDAAKADLKVSESDIRKIRDLAEREVINQFTTAEVKVDFTANNTINSELDLDGVVEYLETRVAERLEAVAEGVYT